MLRAVAFLPRVSLCCLRVCLGLFTRHIAIAVRRWQVHLSHSYMHSKSTTREERVRDALRDMGVSVISGMITSVGASTMLFFTTLQFFSKVSVLGDRSVAGRVCSVHPGRVTASRTTPRAYPYTRILALVLWQLACWRSSVVFCV